MYNQEEDILKVEPDRTREWTEGNKHVSLVSVVQG